MDSKEILFLAAKACDEKKAKNIKLINIDKVSSIAEWILITEGLSDVQVRSISKSVEDCLANKANLLPLRKEGIQEAKWALLDYGEVIINIFQPKERSYYELESFWSNGLLIDSYEQLSS
ncbi:MULTISPECIES: ribosome silencing factor [Prochlorococcus]|uniref:ribosome silencing factor n=1 Tax=Prochlorococcus TaxID=1218 RepID=UPI000533732B|nr:MULTISPECIES: ribosome silencing factor [Prochlorococcus]KGG12400.1 Iojap protein [Prochlorococcus sp. MIT 0601]